jgi:SAM-dependent methyltransferase
MPDAERARSFDAVAAEYERHRPEYPAEALRWAADRLGLPPGARVLDLGAGTGKLTRGLLAAGLDVVAVEPGEPMRDQLRAALPGVEALAGSAEEIPLPDASVDAVAAGQAYHWFDPPRALPELHRVVRDGGGVALLWNWWDARDPLQAELNALLGFPSEPAHPNLPAPPWFRELDRTAVESSHESTPAGIVARMATTSAMLVAEPARREALLQEVRSRASRYGERFLLPQLTHVFVFAKLS